MSLIAFVLIVASAILHAAWNLLAKKNRMTAPFYALISSMGALAWFHVQFWTPVNMAALPGTFWFFLFSSIGFDLLYCWGLIRTYRAMEMATAYPVMRALPILLTALATTMFGLGTPLSTMAKFGMLVVFAGCMFMPLLKFSDCRISDYFNKSMFFVFAVACGTTGYTIFDSQAQKVMAQAAAQVSKPVLSMTYYSTRSLLLASSLWLIVLTTDGNRAVLRDYWKKHNFTPILAGVFASSTYILVLLAMNYVTNVSYVQVFRQLGLPVGLAAGTFFLKERCTATKCFGVALILLGLGVSLVR